MRFPRWKPIHSLPSDTRSSQPWFLVKLKPGGSDLSKGRKGTLQKNAARFLLGKG